MMGATPSAMKILQTSNMIRYTASDIFQLLKDATMCDLSTVPVGFASFPDVYSALMMETRSAIAEGRQPLSYVDISKEDFTPTWLPPEAVGSVASHIAKEFKLATDPNKKGILELRELYRRDSKSRKPNQISVSKPTMDTVYEVSESPSTIFDRDETQNESVISPKNILALPEP